MKILIATTNKGKRREIMEIFEEFAFEPVFPDELGFEDEVLEDALTHEENALIKARYFFAKTLLPTVAEDSGIHLDAFPSELGVHTRRWKGLGAATDQEWIDVFLKEVGALPEGQRGAKFVSVVALVMPGISSGAKKTEIRTSKYQIPDTEEHIFRGETRGRLTAQIEAPLIDGIPISSCFVPEGSERVYAALSPCQKNMLSHRGKAVRKLVDFLKGIKEVS